MKSLLRSIPLTALILSHLATAKPAAPDSALAALRAGQARIDRILREDVPKETPEVWRPKLRKAVNAFIDFGELARRALGRHWETRTPEERMRFQKTMKALIEAAYLARVTERGAYEVVYQGEEPLENGEVRVETVLKGKDAAIPVHYLLYRTESGWRVYDIVTDGLSLLENYRSQFNRIIKRKGFDGLIHTLERKRDQLERQQSDG